MRSQNEKQVNIKKQDTVFIKVRQLKLCNSEIERDKRLEENRLQSVGTNLWNFYMVKSTLQINARKKDFSMCGVGTISIHTGKNVAGFPHNKFCLKNLKN